MKKLYNIISGSKLMSNVWQTKNLFEIGTLPINFITSKLPLLSSLLLFWVYWDKIKQNPFFIIVAIGIFFVVVGIGYIWKYGGFYDGELYNEAELNPVTKEILKAARRINKK